MAVQDDLLAPHGGIFNLLKALEGKTLPSILPSEVMAVGVRIGDRGRGQEEGYCELRVGSSQVPLNKQTWLAYETDSNRCFRANMAEILSSKAPF